MSSEDIVYKATISTSNTIDTKQYLGTTSNTFKERYRNHIKSFTHKKLACVAGGIRGHKGEA